MNGQLDLTIVANNYVPVTITVNKQDGTPLDMTGYAAYLQVFDKKDPTSPLIAYSSGAGSITIATNILSFAFQPSDTVNLQVSTYTDYIIEAVIVDPSGNPVTLTKGDPRLCWGTLTVREQWAVPGATQVQVQWSNESNVTWSDGTKTDWS